MSTSFRSHPKGLPEKAQLSQSDRKPSIRMPSRPSSSNAEAKQSKATQHVSRLAKSTSRNIAQSDKTESRATNTTAAASLPMTAGYNPRTESRVAPTMSKVLSTPSSTPAPPLYQQINNDLRPPPSIQTPSLVSGSSVSSMDSPRSNLLRRKPSTIEQYAAARRAATPQSDFAGVTMYKEDNENSDKFDDSILGITLPQTTYDSASGKFEIDNKAWPIPDNFQTGHPALRGITPPVPNYALTATPSTRYTDSPFSHVPTPSSASSYSPAVVATSSSSTTRLRPQSPTRSRPPVTVRATNQTHNSRLGLPPVRESSTSSSSSTYKRSESKSMPAQKLDQAPKPGSALPIKSKSEQAQAAPQRKLSKDPPKQNTNAPKVKPLAHIPPELAHLNVEPPLKSPNKFPPPRPSRDGTPNLTGMNVPSPVVQSDLPRLYTTYHKRTPSQETPTSAASPSFKTRFGLSPKASSKQSSPRIDSAVSPPPTARTFARDPALDQASSEVPRLTRKDSPAVGRSSNKSPRFGFFSRKPKTDTTKPPEKPQRQPSKGPIAGTGHEGYGRFGMRSRNGSFNSSAGIQSPTAESIASSHRRRQSSGKKSSVSSKDGSDLDDFLRERLNPVVLRGSGSTFSGTTASSDVPVPSMTASSNHSSLDSVMKPQLLPSAMDNAVGPKRSIPRARAPSDSSEDDVTLRYPTLTPSRSLTQTSRTVTPRAINGGLPPKGASFDIARPHTSSSTRDINRDVLSEGKEGLWLRSGKVEPDVKTNRKWNFFQRAQASPRNKTKEQALVTSMASNYPPARGAAHYAMLDPVEAVGLEEVERMIQENETSAEESMSESNTQSRTVPYDRRHSSLVPSPPKTETADAFNLGSQSGQPRLRIRADSDGSESIYAELSEGLQPPPRIRIRPDSEDSTVLLNAEKTVPHQQPHVVEIRRSPIVPQNDPWSGSKATASELKPEAVPAFDFVYTPETPQAPFNTPENPDGGSPAKQPRLSPIGRIPQVVSKRDRERKLSDSSFSRPFARTQPRPTVKPPGSLYNQIRDLASPTDSTSQPVSSTSTNSNELSNQQSDSVDTVIPVGSNRDIDTGPYDRSEFFSFPNRQNSDISYTSSSSTSARNILAIQFPQEDDVWNEYNDLLDEVMLEKPLRTAASSFRWPFQHSTAAHDSPVTGIRDEIGPPPRSQLPPPPTSHTPFVPPSVPQQIQSLMRSSVSSLASPRALSEEFDQYGNRRSSTFGAGSRTSDQYSARSSIPQPSRSSIPVPSRTNLSGAQRTSVPVSSRSSLPRNSSSSLPTFNRSSLPQTSRSSLPGIQGSAPSSARNSRSSGHSRSASLPEANARDSQASLGPSARFNRDTQLLDIAEVDGDEQTAAANLRFGALMTSKWLSFGRVLFSPAHNEMRLADEPRVLIIDGMGSDWSYYVALSYPSATVYNLGPNPVNGFSDWPGVNQKPPTNHLHINHTAISAAFPFPKGFFTAVVLRFPLATTDQAYQSCVCECKRVLRPGGYLEVAALDLDLMNMGNKARREIRGLKTRLQQHDPNVSLRNLSDVLVRLLGRRGFEEVQRCIVGVPAAGRIPRSQDISSISSGGSGRPVWKREDRQSLEFSFADLLEDARASQIGEAKGSDENITKMVAKVGRWWYSTCYEKALLHQNHSIWNDSSLLRECEKQGTSFRLLICYAQKPAQTKRRTVSV